MRVYYFKEDIRNVTEYYYGIILKALRQKGAEQIMMDRCNLSTARQIPKKDYILATSLKAFIILYVTGHRNFIYWYQGITPEENFLMFKKKWRFYIYSVLEKLSLKTVKYKIGVSKYLFEHFEKKYNIIIDYDTVFVMPCFNSELNKESFFSKGKYETNTFCYAGGTQAWQGFDQIIKIYSEIEKRRSDVFLKIFSKDLVSARQAVQKAQITNYSIDCLAQDEMDNALADCKFGFIIREDNNINNVATPTKLGTYMANGVIPVYSSTINSFKDLARDYKYLCCVDNNSDVIESISQMMDTQIEPVKVYEEYKKVFDYYYNKDQYVKDLVLFFK